MEESTEKKIFVNTLPVTLKSGGIKTFLLELLYAFGELHNSQIKYCLICSPKNEFIFLPFLKYPQFSLLTINVDIENPFKRIYYEQRSLPGILNKEKNAILLNVCNIANFRCKIPQVTIIQAQMSIAALRKKLPPAHNSISLFHRLYYDLLLERSICRSVKTIAISNYMVQFLEKYKDKIEVIHEGVNVNAFQSNVLKQTGTIPYILSVSTLFPHKNMNKVIQAFHLFIKKTGLNYHLLIVGKDPDGQQVKKLQRLVDELCITDKVFFKGWVEDEEIPGLYANAALFLYLSSMEFFGLPVLEAMASGIPVIAGNKMSIPEVVNDAGILVEPDEIEKIAEHIEHVMTDKVFHDSLIQAGEENVKKFNWKFTAQKFEKIFIEIY